MYRGTCFQNIVDECKFDVLSNEAENPSESWTIFNRTVCSRLRVVGECVR